jgi:hypothetical protein
MPIRSSSPWLRKTLSEKLAASLLPPGARCVRDLGITWMDVVSRVLNCVVPGTRCHLLRIAKVRELKEPNQTAYEIGARVQIVSPAPDQFSHSELGAWPSQRYPSGTGPTTSIPFSAAIRSRTLGVAFPSAMARLSLSK